MWGGHYLEVLVNTVVTIQQEVNPRLFDVESASMTVSVGCSLVRAALGP